MYCGQLFCTECLEKVEGTAIAFLNPWFICFLLSIISVIYYIFLISNQEFVYFVMSYVVLGMCNHLECCTNLPLMMIIIGFFLLVYSKETD